MNEKNSPWTILDKTVKYENNWIEVVHQNVLNPKGGSGIYGTVNFKNIAVGVVPIDDENNTWLVGQYRFPLNEYSWEIPEGGCPIATGEAVLDTAKRELKEETGLLAEKWTLISKLHTSNSVCNEVAYIFLAEKLSQSESEPEDTEQLIVKKVSFHKALEMVLNDEITDSMSVAGILKVARLKGL
jgi:ADP-ribose pyrophosphatase